MNWPHQQCILCLESTPLTDEHLIPESIGGRLIARFLCKSCNSRLGQRIEATVKHDVAIRLAVDNLAEEIPEFAQKFREGQQFIGVSVGGRALGRIKKGRFRVNATRLPDGSLIQPTSVARKSLARLIAKLTADPSAVDAALKRFDEAPENTRVPIAHGYEIVKWSVNDLSPRLGGTHLDDRLPLKIAYEFLACHLGEAIYESVLPLQDARNALRSDVPAKRIRVEHLHAEKYAPFHGIALEQDATHTVVAIRLFGWLAFRVHFQALAYHGPRYVYTLNLRSGRHSTMRIDVQ